MDWYGMSCARPCALLRGPAFLVPLYHALKILSPTKMWLKGRVFLINPQIAKHPRLKRRNGWNIESSSPSFSMCQLRPFQNHRLLQEIFGRYGLGRCQWEFRRLLPLKREKTRHPSFLAAHLFKHRKTYALMFHHHSSLKPRWTSFKT